jgi:hypothetical protein
VSVCSLNCLASLQCRWKTKDYHLHHICPSVSLSTWNNLVPVTQIFVEFKLETFLICQQFQFSLKLEKITATLYGHIFFFFFNWHYNPWVGFGLLNYCWAFSAGRFYTVSLPVARQTPNLEEDQGFRAFQLSPQEAPSVWSNASKPNSGRWNYGREMAEKFCRKWQLPRHFWVLLHAVKHDMGQTALLPLWRKACWGFFRPKNLTALARFEPANLGTKGQHATSRPPKPHYMDTYIQLW